MLWGSPSRAEQGVRGGHQVAGLRRLHDLAMVKNIQKLNQKMYLLLIKTTKNLTKICTIRKNIILKHKKRYVQNIEIETF